MEKINTQPSPKNFSRVLALLGESPAKLEALSRSLTEEQLCEPLSDNEWSFKQHLAHLLSREEIASQSIYYALLVDDPILPDIHPQRHWAPLVDYEHFPVPELFSSYNFRRATLLRVLAELTDAGWENTVSRASKRPETIYRLARLLALHEVYHMEDIAGKLKTRTPYL